MILVTGASQGIGYECAKALLGRTSSRVLMTGRSGERLRRARAALPPASQERLQIRVCDQGNPHDVDRLRGVLEDANSTLEGAILTVGINPMYTEGPRRIHSLSAETIEATIRTNCTHAMLITSTVLEGLRSRNGGVLIWVGSQAPRVGLRGAGLYCATKSFLSGLARSAQNEYASKGVHVVLANPGLVRTPRTAAVVDDFATRHGATVREAGEVGHAIVTLFLSAASSPVEVDL